MCIETRNIINCGFMATFFHSGVVVILYVRQRKVNFMFLVSAYLGISHSIGIFHYTFCFLKTKDIRELKQCLLSRRPNGTELSARRPTNCFLPPYWSIRTAKFFFFFKSKEWFQAPNKSSLNLCK